MLLPCRRQINITGDSWSDRKQVYLSRNYKVSFYEKDFIEFPNQIFLSGSYNPLYKTESLQRKYSLICPPGIQIEPSQVAFKILPSTMYTSHKIFYSFLYALAEHFIVHKHFCKSYKGIKLNMSQQWPPHKADCSAIYFLIFIFLFESQAKTVCSYSTVTVGRGTRAVLVH